MSHLWFCVSVFASILFVFTAICDTLQRIERKIDALSRTVKDEVRYTGVVTGFVKLCEKRLGYKRGSAATSD
jgi:hypothetical protein